MKAVIQHLRNGETEVIDAPAPQVSPGHLLIKTETTLVSSGTERMLREFGQGSYLSKAMQQPERVREVLDKIRTDGLVSTFDAVNAKLNQPLSLGYCNVGKVIEVGQGVEGFGVGDRVVSNGPHAEVVNVPINLCAHVPDGVKTDVAVFSVIGAIALQGIRLANPSLGESFVVYGLGLVGMLAVQLLRAQGCRVLGVDIDPSKVELARDFGIETCLSVDVQERAQSFSRGVGIDGALIAASTSDSQLVNEAASLCRKRGRIVLIGVAGLELSRSLFYEKELSFQVSCSYGPGRYDPEYEEKGRDYPLGFVRWTEQRNFVAVLDMMQEGKVDTASLITFRAPLEEASSAYDKLTESGSLGILLDYSVGDISLEKSVSLEDKGSSPSPNMECSFLGGGNHATRVLMPAFRKAGVAMGTLVTDSGVSAAVQGRNHSFRKITTDVQEALETDCQIVVIATRHNLHAEQVIKALEARKHVFVEKPLALSLAEIDEIENVLRNSPGCSLMVGFNRRFAPLVQQLKAQLEKSTQPKVLNMTMNAGKIPTDHWTQNPEIGGGRIIGEACHYVDLMRYLVGSPIRDFSAACVENINGTIKENCIITLSFDDGSIGSFHYLANGGKTFPKERIEVFGNDGVLQLDNFKKLKGYGWRGFTQKREFVQDKGHRQCVEKFVESITQGRRWIIPIDEIMEVARVCIEIDKQLERKTRA